MTSMPASRSARAMTLAPRSCPSRPGLATSTRIGEVRSCIGTLKNSTARRCSTARGTGTDGGRSASVGDGGGLFLCGKAQAMQETVHRQSLGEDGKDHHDVGDGENAVVSRSGLHGE